MPKPKEILLYGAIYSETAALFHQMIEEAGDEPIMIRINCIGGEPEYGWGMAAKFNEYVGSKEVLVDGQAASMGMFFLCYAEKGKVSAYDVAEFLIHRCAYSPWIEKNPEYFTDAMRENLVRVNASLQKALAARIDVEAFENLKQVKEKGIKFKDIFSLDARHDIYISAADAKKIGLVDKVIKLTPQKAAEINSFMEKAAAGSAFKKVAALPEQEETEDVKNSKKNKTMTIEELKEKHPDAYKAAVAVGVKQELDRVKSCLVFQEIDPAGVKTAIESGEPLSETQKAEFSLKSFNKAATAKVEETNKTVVTTGAESEDQKKSKEKEAKTEEFLKAAGLRK